MNRKIRALLAGSVMVVSLTGGAVLATAGPAGALYPRQTTTGTCTEGATKTDQWGNVYKCIGGKWTLWSMPAVMWAP